MGCPQHRDANETMPHTLPPQPADLAALGLTPDRPIAWIPAIRGRTDEAVGVISFRWDASSGWEPEHLVCARTPEGNAALAKMLGLAVGVSGWVSMSGALDEAAERGLCFVHQKPRADGRYFVVANKDAGKAAPVEA
jgi:hypothetical protein